MLRIVVHRIGRSSAHCHLTFFHAAVLVGQGGDELNPELGLDG